MGTTFIDDHELLRVSVLALLPLGRSCVFVAFRGTERLLLTRPGNPLDRPVHRARSDMYTRGLFPELVVHFHDGIRVGHELDH